MKDVDGKRKIVRYFKHQLLKYVWDDRENGFKYLQGLDNGTTTLSKLLEKCHGLTADEHESQYVHKIGFSNTSKNWNKNYVREKGMIKFFYRIYLFINIILNIV